MIRVVSHDPVWVIQFGVEAECISGAFGEDVVRVHHIGSTAVPGMKAKPVIDILLEVTSLEVLDQKSTLFGSLGYEVMGEFGIPGRRYFRKDDSNGVRTHQVHAFEVGVPDVVRHIAFRDYMRTHPAIAENYGVLKERLAEACPLDRDAYINGKDAFVKEHERIALLWAQSSQ